MLKINLNVRDLLNKITFSHKKFRKVLISTYKEFPVFNHAGFIIKGIEQICKDFLLPDAVKARALKIFKSNRSILMSTTGNVTKGTAISLALISLGLRKQIPIMKLAKNIGTSCSAICSRIFKLLSYRKIIVPHKIKDLDVIIPDIYRKIIKR
jgi:hypothetical protein